MFKPDDFDHALPFLFFTTLGVIGMISILCVIAAKMHINGLSGLLKGGWS
jgi:hypothetical protein